jgi:hypothetical protein
MVTVLIYLVVALLLVSLVWWLIDYIPVPAPINHWAKIIVIVIAALVIISVLLSVAGVNTGLSLR